MPKRETEEEMLAKVVEMTGGEEGKAGEEKEVEGVILEPENTTVIPRAEQETGLQSEKDIKVDTDIVDVNKGADIVKDVVKPAESDPTEDPITNANAKKRIHDAQTKMHTATSGQAESDRLLQEATLKIQSYESIIAKSGANSTEGIVAQQKIDDTSNEAIANLQSLEAEYPEIAKPLMAVFKQMQGQLDSMEQKQVASNEAAEVVGEKVLSKMHYSRISEFHPDYAVINKSPEFTEWVNGLSPFERSAALMIKENGDADESISMLDKFKEDTGYGGTDKTVVPGDNKDITDAEKIANDNLIKAQAKVSPTFTKKKVLKLTSDNKQLTVADMRKMKPTKENEDKILQAMASGNLI